MKISQLPTVTFVERGSSRVLDLPRSGRRIAALSGAIQRHFDSASRIGILFRTSEELILYWLACLEANKVPLILQYPTRKLSRDYWLRTLSQTIENLNIGGIICGAEMSSEVGHAVRQLVHEPNLEIGDRVAEEVQWPDVLQMSSGTTGSRKGILFNVKSLQAHIQSYNEVMGLTSDDCIVSWLPLYHDMGFIAAFVMPLLLGVPIVMIDPITWVEDRELLFDAIREYGGTVVYMPNFGFEVMSRHRCDPAHLGSVRLWISCSEPTYRASIERFCDATETPPDRIAVCYAMAENIFAVSQRQGIRVVAHNGQEVVSCGPPLPGTDTKIIDGEIWVRSRSSISSYADGAGITDADGYYPTGDMGFVDNGEIFVEGRRHDLLIQAGRKFFLSDFDFILNKVEPSCQGRGAALALRDDRVGTEKLVILVERDDVASSGARAALHKALAAELPVEDFEVHFVPQEFITKTSSGKINRGKTAADFHAVGSEKNAATRDFAARLAELFPFQDRSKPIGQILDSLGLVMMQLLAEDYGLSADRNRTINELIEQSRCKERVYGPVEEVLRLVSAIDLGSPVFALTEPDLRELSEELGVPVVLEHICLPPVHFIWQDILFRDYFLPRDLDKGKYEAFLSTLAKLDNASVLLFSDFTEFCLGGCAFPILDRKLRRAPVADLLAVRFQRLALQHHEMPVGDVELGCNVSSAQREEAFHNLSEYFGVPLFRAAHLRENASESSQWEYGDFDHDWREHGHRRFVNALKLFLRKNQAKIPLRKSEWTNRRLSTDDLPHFCSFIVNPALIETVASRFHKYIIQGMPNSLPYLIRRIRELNKEVVFSPTLNRNGSLDQAVQNQGNACVIQTGAWRECHTELPVIRMMHGDGADMKNIPADLVLPGNLHAETDIRRANAVRYIMEPRAAAIIRHLDHSDFSLFARTWPNFTNESITDNPPWVGRCGEAERAQLWRGCAAGWMQYGSEDFAAARANFAAARSEAGHKDGLLWANASRGLLLSLFRLNLSEAACGVGRELLEWAPSQTTANWQEVYYAIANCEVAEGNRERAIALFDMILSVNPEHKHVLAQRRQLSESLQQEQTRPVPKRKTKWDWLPRWVGRRSGNAPPP